jgi:hypothetical protein
MIINRMKKYERKLRILIRGTISALVFRMRFPAGFKSSEALLIFGAPRSGSTWLAEIVSSIPGHSQVFEPLYPLYVKEARGAGVKKNMYLEPEQKWEEGRVFLERVLSGKLMNSWLASQMPLSKVLSTRRLVIKFVRANLIAGWICENFPVKPPALVIRHPCAVVSSLLQKNWTPGKDVLLANPYFVRHPEIRQRCVDLSTAEEMNALAWCLHYHAPLSLPKPYPFVLLCYEKMVRDGAYEIGRLFEEWNLELTEDIIRKLNKPSDTSTPTSQIMYGSDPLAGWKKRLSHEQIERILGVVDIFGMNFYSEKMEPNYARMARFPE